MKKIISAFLMIVAASMMVVSEADAARLGGGRTIGRQSPTAARQAPIQKQAAPQTAQKPAAAAPQAPAQRPSMWKGILGGALLGLGLGALLSHLGIGGGLASMISTILMVALIGFAIMFIYRMLTRKKETPATATAYSGNTGGNYGGNYGSTYGSASGSYAGGSTTPEIGSALQQPAGSTYTPYGVPSDFDEPAFIRSAKTHFIRLQASWDRADIDDIREFTSPEMFAELKMQLQERGASPNVTDVIDIDAALLGIETVGNQQMASVRFTGTIREGTNAPTSSVDEIWNLTRPLSSSGGWVLAGIQQTS